MSSVPELLVLQKLGQVHLGLGLMDGDVVSACHGDDINIFGLLLLQAQRSLTNANCDAIVGDRIPILERLEVEVLLVVVDHLLELPVGVVQVPLAPLLLLHHCRSLNCSSSITRYLCIKTVTSSFNLKTNHSNHLHLLHFLHNARPSLGGSRSCRCRGFAHRLCHGRAG